MKMFDRGNVVEEIRMQLPRSLLGNVTPRISLGSNDAALLNCLTSRHFVAKQCAPQHYSTSNYTKSRIYELTSICIVSHCNLKLNRFNKRPIERFAILISFFQVLCGSVSLLDYGLFINKLTAE